MKQLIPALFFLFLSVEASSQSQSFFSHYNENPNSKVLTHWEIAAQHNSKDPWGILPFFFIDREAAFMALSWEKWELRISAESIYDLDWWKEKFKKPRSTSQVPLSELEYETEAPQNMKVGITISF